MNVFGATRKSERNILFSELVVSNKSIKNELTLCARLTDKHEIDIESLDEKSQNIIKQVSLILSTIDDTEQVISKLISGLGSISDLESRIQNVETFISNKIPVRHAEESTEPKKEKTITKSIPIDTPNNDLEYQRIETYGEK